MKGIEIDGEGVADHAGTYKVCIDVNGSKGCATIYDSELGNLRNYELMEDEAMIDYTQMYATLSSFLMVYMAARDDTALAMKDYMNSRYAKKKSVPFRNEAKDIGDFSNNTLQSMLTDTHARALIECEQGYLKLRNNHTHYNRTCDRLERSILILERAWDTARSINANNRRSMGG